MKFEMRPGEWFSKALSKGIKLTAGWTLSTRYFSSLEEVLNEFPPEMWAVVWPLEIDEYGLIYAPTEEELKDE